MRVWTLHCVKCGKKNTTFCLRFSSGKINLIWFIRVIWVTVCLINRFADLAFKVADFWRELLWTIFAQLFFPHFWGREQTWQYSNVHRKFLGSDAGGNVLYSEKNFVYVDAWNPVSIIAIHKEATNAEFRIRQNFSDISVDLTIVRFL